MVNTEKLRAMMKEKNITVASAAKAMNMDDATFYRRMNTGGEKFTVGEVVKLAEVLNMEKATFQDIFFDEKLA